MIMFKQKKDGVINERNHIKMQKFVKFVKKNLKMNMLKIRNIKKKGTIITMQGNIEVLQIAYAI